MELTLGQFIDNIEKNGFPQIIGEMFVEVIDDELHMYVPSPENGACALGQGIYNTFNKVPSSSFRSQFLKNLDNAVYNFVDTIVQLNDEAEEDIPTIVRIVREQYAAQLGTVIWNL